MTAPKPLSAVVKLSREDRLAMIVTPIFYPEMGYRLRLARMRLKMDQAQLAKALGTTQRVISALESGKQYTTRDPFSLARFKAILGESTSYVLFGTGAEKWVPHQIVESYWHERLVKKPSNT